MSLDKKGFCGKSSDNLRQKETASDKKGFCGNSIDILRQKQQIATNCAKRIYFMLGQTLNADRWEL
jgi:hypothetical protein